MPEFSPNHKVPGFSVKNIPHEKLAKKSFCGLKYFHLKIKSKLSRYLTFERGFKSQLGKSFSYEKKYCIGLNATPGFYFLFEFLSEVLFKSDLPGVVVKMSFY